MDDTDKPDAIEFWDYACRLQELANTHWHCVRVIETRHDFVLDAFDEEKAEADFNNSVASLTNELNAFGYFAEFSMSKQRPISGDLVTLHATIEQMSLLLKRMVIYRSLNQGRFNGHSDDWSDNTANLHYSINYCAQNHDEIIDIVYQRAISVAEPIKPKTEPIQQLGELPRLGRNKKDEAAVVRKKHVRRPVHLHHATICQI